MGCVCLHPVFSGIIQFNSALFKVLVYNNLTSTHEQAERDGGEEKLPLTVGKHRAEPSSRRGGHLPQPVGLEREREGERVRWREVHPAVFDPVQEPCGVRVDKAQRPRRSSSDWARLDSLQFTPKDQIVLAICEHSDRNLFRTLDAWDCYGSYLL